MRKPHFAWLLVAALVLTLGGSAFASQRAGTQAPRLTADAEGVVDSPGEYDLATKGDPEDEGIAPDDQHGPGTGHLPASNANVDLVGKHEVGGIREGRISDVGTLGDYAYLGTFPSPQTTDPCTDTGIYVIDISDPAHPVEVPRPGDVTGLPLIPQTPGTWAGEGVHAIHIDTPLFEGDVLFHSNERCQGRAPGTGAGGMSIWNITDPRAPTPLAQGVGDANTGDMGAPEATVHDSHSVFAWDAGDKAYAVIVDNVENGTYPVDIFDVTNPAAPVLIAETGAAEWPGLVINGYGDNAHNHDMIVRKVDGHWLLLVSYWDGGYVVVNVDDPANPVFIEDSDFPATDPLFNISPPEGNAHEAEWEKCPEEGVGKVRCGDPAWILAADEDFSPYRVIAKITSGTFNGEEFAAVGANDVPQIDADTSLVGPTYYVGLACNPSRPADGIPPGSEGPPVPAAPSADAIAVVQRGLCTFQTKLQNVQNAGYQGGIVFNSTAAGNGCETLIFMAASGDIPFLFVARSTGFKILNVSGYDPAACRAGTNPSPPEIGTRGNDVSLTAVFDGWGYLNLINAETLEHVDQYAVPEARDERYAQGFGDLSVHEVTTDPRFRVGYLSWYSAGFRVVDFSSGELVETGHYIDEGGNNLWGVEMHQKDDGRQFILGSDRDYGLYIYRYGDDVAIRKADTPDIVRLGQTIRYVLTVTNTGTIAADNTVVRDRLPANLTLVSASSSQGSCQGTRTIICNLGRLAEDAQARVTIVARATRAGFVTNTGRASSADVDYDLGNNAASETTRIRGALAPAGCAMGVQPSRFREDRRQAVTIRVRENDGDPAANRVVTLRGAGVDRTARTNAVGVAETTVRPRRAGTLRVNVPSLANCTRSFRVVGAGPALTG